MNLVVWYIYDLEYLCLIYLLSVEFSRLIYIRFGMIFLHLYSSVIHILLLYVQKTSIDYMSEKIDFKREINDFIIISFHVYRLKFGKFYYKMCNVKN